MANITFQPSSRDTIYLYNPLIAYTKFSTGEKTVTTLLVSYGWMPRKEVHNIHNSYIRSNIWKHLTNNMNAH